MARKSNKKKKTPEIIKKKLLASTLELLDVEEDYLELNEKVKNAKEPTDGIALIKKWEGLLKEANRKIINIIGK